MVALVNGFIKKQLPTAIIPRQEKPLATRVVVAQALRQLEGFAVRDADDVAAW